MVAGQDGGLLHEDAGAVRQQALLWLLEPLQEHQQHSLPLMETKQHHKTHQRSTTLQHKAVKT